MVRSIDQVGDKLGLEEFLENKLQKGGSSEETPGGTSLCQGIIVEDGHKEEEDN